MLERNKKLKNRSLQSKKFASNLWILQLQLLQEILAKIVLHTIAAMKLFFIHGFILFSSYSNLHYKKQVSKANFYIFNFETQTSLK